MTTQAAGPKAPGFPFEQLFEAEDAATGAALPEPFADVYGPWTLPADEPYVYSNFIVSRDGRVSFNQPGAYLPDQLPVGIDNDRWLMALLRGRADACVLGDASLLIAPEVGFTVGSTEPALAEPLAELRRQEGLRPEMLPVILSASGRVRPDADVWRRPGSKAVIATTRRGARAAIEFASSGSPAGPAPDSVPEPGLSDPPARPTRRGAQSPATPPAGPARDASAQAGRTDIAVEVFDADWVDPNELVARLHAKYGARRIICEGGPTVYARFLAAGAIHEEFFTLSPLVIGAAPNAHRPTVVEGVAFQPEAAPVSQLISVRKAGDLLFLRSRYKPIQGGAS
ncbi:MAG: dihydrofolate reductase family protein [Bifidobacteriaceae bacterium]|jgi:5-amino-6-(5-phosphoribosylamino)uracil reductase|nr:dihydrofolate reductase family protein [Bifidobacteriaceae bacterium]